MLLDIRREERDDNIVETIRDRVETVQSKQIDVSVWDDWRFCFVVLLNSRGQEIVYTGTYSCNFMPEMGPRPDVSLTIIALMVETPTLAALATIPRPMSR